MYAFLLRTLLFLVFSVGHSFATEDPENIAVLEGAWQGTLGKQNIIACFERNRGSYVKLDTYSPVSLFASDTTRTAWYENQPTHTQGIWHIHAVTENTLQGEWLIAGEKKPRSISLFRINLLSKKPLDYCPVYSLKYSENPFGNHAVANRFSTLSGKKYQVVSAINNTIRSIQLEGKDPYIRSLNIRLINELKNSTLAYLDCLKDQKDNATDPIAETTLYTEIKPVFWNSHWISFLKKTSLGCHDASPTFSVSYITWDLTNGKPINLKTWLHASPLQNSAEQNPLFLHNRYTAPDKLNKIITYRIRTAFSSGLSTAPVTTTNCTPLLLKNSNYQLGLDTQGIVFYTRLPREYEQCNLGVVIPYTDLRPFLTQAGQNAIQRAVEKAHL